MGGTTVAEGDWVTIDGFTGKVYAGQLALADSPIERARAGDPEARKEKIWQAYERFMGRADAVRRLRVRANADTPGQSANAIERGAEGIGLCRTEHMFLGEERVAAVRTMIFASSAEEEQAAYDTLLPLQRDDFVGIFAGDGRQAGHGAAAGSAVARVPARPGRAGRGRGAGHPAGRDRRWRSAATRPCRWTRPSEMLAKVNDLHEANPMLGLRGVRLGILKPGLYAMQVRAICEAAARVKAEGGSPIVEIMIPLAATREELAQVREELEPVARQTLAGRRPGGGGGVGDDDRAAPGGPGRRRDRRGGRVLLLWHQRPDPDHLRVLPRRHRQVPRACTRNASWSRPTRS